MEGAGGRSLRILSPSQSISSAVLLLVVCSLLLCGEASFPLAVCLQAKPGRWFSLRLHIFSTLDLFFFPDDSTELRLVK